MSTSPPRSSEHLLARAAVEADRQAGLATVVPDESEAMPGHSIRARVNGVRCHPLPSLDIALGTNGLLWFRDKSHYVSVEEVAALLSSDAEVVIIGTGWHGAVRVDPAVQQIEGVKVHILRTPAAFELFNDYVSRGRRVILIAHSTC